MKTTTLLSLLMLSCTLLFAQETVQFKTKPISKKLQEQVGENFQFLSFNLDGFTSEFEKEQLLDELKQNPNFKKVSVTSYNEFHGFVKKDYMDNLIAFFKERDLTINTNQNKRSNLIPEDFPDYIDTGNSKIDRANYHDAKQEWIRNNPDRFEKIKHLNLDNK